MLLIFISAALVIFSSYFLAKSFSFKKTFIDFLLTLFLFIICQIVLVETILGVLGKLYLGNVLLLQAIIFIITYFASGRIKGFSFEKENFSFIYNSKVLIFAISVFLVFFSPRLWKILINPPLSADTLLYHLSFPVTWLKNGNLGNPMLIFAQTVSQAATNSASYYPINAELLFLWLILPLRNALLANVAQAPFYFIAIFTIYSILRKFSISREISFFMAMLLVLVPNFFKHISEGAYIDIICAALFFMVINNLLFLKSDFTKKNALLLGMSIGVFLGTKTTSIFWVLSLAPLLIYVLISNTKRLKSFDIFKILFLLFIAILIFGSYPYIRNFVLTKNIFYPIKLSIFGKTIMPGYVNRIEYADLTYPFKDFSVKKLFFSEGLGLQLFVFILPATFLPLLLAFFDKKKIKIEEALIYLIPLFMFLVYFFYIRVYWARYLYPFLGAGLISSAIFFNKFNWGKRYINTAGILCVFTSIAELDKGMRIFISLFISILLFVAIWASRNFKFLLKIYNRRAVKLFLFAAIIILLFLSLTALNIKYQREQFYRYCLFFEDKEAALAWKWLDLHIAAGGSRIAYTGRAHTYPLFGTNFKNEVFYVSVNDKPSIPHYYSDGQYRKEQDYAAWRRNIKNSRIDYLFIYLPFGKEDFPVENDWALRDSKSFRLAFANNKVRIYSVKAGDIYQDANN
ncbi:MAG: hypothetical protein FJZ11_00320 [Candidatus Omnitrophica bacterium]|nr:hypothetical protein [Candidatus Omnitrophota bacterium]